MRETMCSKAQPTSVVVVGSKVMMESTKLCCSSCANRDSPNKGPLGEMLAFKQWNASAASKWRDVIYVRQ